MTSLTLTVGGIDFLPQYKTNSAVIRSQLINQSDSMTIVITKKASQSAPLVGNEIIFKDGSRFLFGGFVTRVTPKETGIGQMIEYTVEATDYTYILINKRAQESYESQTLYYIVNDLITAHVDAGYGISVSGVATGPTITTVAFNHITLRKCFEQLAYLTGYIWWIGYDKVIHFADPSSIASAPETLTDAIKNHMDVKITIDASQVRNDIIVLGSTEESSNYTQNILGDAHAREWFLLDRVTSMTSVKLNGVAKTIGIDPTDDETLYYFMYNPERGSIRVSSGSTTPIATDLIEVIFTRPLTIIVEVQDTVAIATMKAIEGGDGKHAYTIIDNTIISSDQARQRALQELALYASPVLSGQFKTRTGLLTAGSYWTAGTAIQVNLPSWGISTTTTYVIQRVTTTMVETGSEIEYYYDVTFGGRMLGVVDFLQALAEPQTPIDISGILQTILAENETITVGDVVALGTQSSQTETVSVGESLTNNGFNFGTIFVTGPLAPTGTHRVFKLNGSLLG